MFFCFWVEIEPKREFDNPKEKIKFLSLRLKKEEHTNDLSR